MDGRQPEGPGDDRIRSRTAAQLSLAVIEQAGIFVEFCDANLNLLFLNLAGREMVGLPADADIGTLRMTDLLVAESHSIIEQSVWPAMVQLGRWEGKLNFQHFADPFRSQERSSSIFRLDGSESEFIGIAIIGSEIFDPKRPEHELTNGQSQPSSKTPEYVAGQRGLLGDGIVRGEDYLSVKDEQSARPNRKGTIPFLVTRGHEVRAAERLKLNEAKLRKASELVGLAVFSWDSVSDSVECDDRLRAMWGLPPGEPVNRNVLLTGVHPDDRERVDDAIAASLDPSGDGRYDIEYRVIGRDDGVERWISTLAQTTFQDGSATAFVGAAVDLSEKRQAEAAIRVSEARFRAFAKHSANLLWIIDPARNMIDYRSPAYERIWGEPVKDAPRGLDDWLERIHPEDLQSVRSAFETIKGGEVVLHEYRIIRPDGSVRWLRDASFPIRGDNAQVALIGGIVEDLTFFDGNHVYVLGKTAGESGRLANMLRGAGFQVRSFESASTLVDIAPVLTPGCILIDLRAEVKNAIQVPRELKARSISLPTVVIGSEVADPEAIIAAMKAGAADYLIPPLDDDVLKAALASAMAEMHGLGRIDSSAAEYATRVARLTPREREVLEGLVNGGTNKTIARDLGISPRTVELYRSQVMHRLDASNLSELIQIATAAGVRPRTEASHPVPKLGRNPT